MTAPTGAELLRLAARTMREKAEAATPGPWVVTPNEPPTHYVHPEGRVITTGLADDQADEIADTFMHCDSVHIASWHPAVALAVAAWLDAAYDDERRFAAMGAHGFPGENPAFAVARTYLGVS